MTAPAVRSPQHADAAGAWSSASLIPLLLVSLGALAGSLWLSLGMKLKACPLCFYQRTFVMAVVAVLLLGMATRVAGPLGLSLLTLPLVWAGLFVAADHVYLENSGRLECPAGVAAIGTAPQQSLAALALMLLVNFITIARHAAGDGMARRGTTVAVVVGALLAYAGIASSPPLPPKPTKPYDAPPEICRPPFVAPD